MGPGCLYQGPHRALLLGAGCVALHARQLTGRGVEQQPAVTFDNGKSLDDTLAARQLLGRDDESQLARAVVGRRRLDGLLGLVSLEDDDVVEAGVLDRLLDCGASDDRPNHRNRDDQGYRHQEKDQQVQQPVAPPGRLAVGLVSWCSTARDLAVQIRAHVRILSWIGEDRTEQNNTIIN